jgi:hypothetical protein
LVTKEQITAAQNFITSCEPANALRHRPATQNHEEWRAQLLTARQTRRAARDTMLELCGTREVYQEAIKAAFEVRRTG